MAAPNDEREALAAAKSVIGETLTEFQKQCRSLDYRRFVALVRCIGVTMIRSLGGHRISFIKTGDIYTNVTRQTEVGQHLLCLLGFTENDGDSNGVSIDDLRSNKCSLKAFAELTANAVCIHQRDPLAAQPLPDDANLGFSAIYLTYHALFELLGLTAANDDYNKYFFPSLGSRILFSIEAIESAADRLCVMLPESGSRTEWNDVKEKIVRYVYSEGKSCSDESLESAILAFFDAVSNELKSVVPSNLQFVMKYASKTMLVLYALARAQDRVALDFYPAYRTLIADLGSGVFTDEYGRRVDETCAILSEFAEEFAGNLYDVCRWKAQNMLTHFRSESFGSLKPRTLQSGVDGRMKSLRRLLTELKREGGPLLYLRYIQALYTLVSDVLQRDVDFSSHHSAAIKNSEHVAVLASKSRLALSVIYLLGYEDVPPAIAETYPGSMILRDQERSKPVMQYFLRLVKNDVVMAKGDICCRRPIDTISDRASQVVYLGYILRFRICFLALYTPSQFFGVVEAEVVASFAAVEALATKMNVLKSGTRLRGFWGTIRQQTLKYLRTGDRHGERSELSDFFEEIIDMFIQEMPNTPAIRLLSFFQNLFALIGYTSHGSMFEPEQCESYLHNGDGRKVPYDAFSVEFMDVHERVLGLVDEACKRNLTETELNRLHELCIWQVDNALSEFRPESAYVGLIGGGGDGGGGDLMSMLMGMMQQNEGRDREGGDDGTDSGNDQRRVRVVESDSDSEDDGEEKRDDDEKEKEDKSDSTSEKDDFFDEEERDKEEDASFENEKETLDEEEKDVSSDDEKEFEERSSNEKSVGVSCASTHSIESSPMELDDGTTVSLETCSVSSVADSLALLERVDKTLRTRTDELAKAKEELGHLQKACETPNVPSSVKTALEKAITGKEEEILKIDETLRNLTAFGNWLREERISQLSPSQPEASARQVEAKVTQLNCLSSDEVRRLLKAIVEWHAFSSDITDNVPAPMLAAIIRAGFDQAGRIESVLGLKLKVL